MGKTSYIEEQRPHLFWVSVFALIVPGFAIYGIVQQVIMGQPFGNHPAPNLVLYLVLIIGLFTSWLVFRFKLLLLVDEEGIHYAFKPLHRKHEMLKWEEIDKCYVRKYKPMREYGGWGWRYGCRGGRAFNMSGNMGLQIETKSGKKILIGTRRPDELQKVIMELFHNKEAE